MNSPHDIIADRADFLSGHMKKDRIRSVAILVLYDLCFPVNCEGFDFLELIIPLAFEKRVQISMQEMYLYIAELFPGYNEDSVSNAIQELIQKAWKNRNGGRWNYYFPDYVIRRKKAPSNKEFIKSIVFFMDMWQDSYEKEANQCERV